MSDNDIGPDVVVTGKQQRKLLGDRIAEATKAVGIKPCGGCKKRQKWTNKKHQQVLDFFEKVKKID